jgi:hypothetical protein
MPVTGNIGRNKINEQDLPYHLRNNGRGGNNVINTTNSNTQTPNIITLTAGATLNANRVVRLTSGLLYHAKPKKTEFKDIIGIALDSVANTQLCRVLIYGKLKSELLSLNVSKMIFLRGDGELSQDILTTTSTDENSIIVIGKPIATDELILQSPFRKIFLG